MVVEVLFVNLKWHEVLSVLWREDIINEFSVTLWCFPPTYNTDVVVSDNNDGNGDIH